MPKKWLLIVAKGVFLMTCKLGHKDYEGRKLSIVFTKLDSSSPVQTYMREGVLPYYLAVPLTWFFNFLDALPLLIFRLKDS